MELFYKQIYGTICQVIKTFTRQDTTRTRMYLLYKRIYWFKKHSFFVYLYRQSEAYKNSIETFPRINKSIRRRSCVFAFPVHFDVSNSTIQSLCVCHFVCLTTSYGHFEFFFQFFSSLLSPRTTIQLPDPWFHRKKERKSSLFLHCRLYMYTI